MGIVPIPPCSNFPDTWKWSMANDVFTMQCKTLLCSMYVRGVCGYFSNFSNVRLLTHNTFYRQLIFPHPLLWFFLRMLEWQFIFNNLLKMLFVLKPSQAMNLNPSHVLNVLIFYRWHWTSIERDQKSVYLKF